MKKSKYLKRVFLIFWVVVLVLPSFACGFGGSGSAVLEIEDMETEQADAYSYDIIGGSDVMPIIGYYGPRPNNYSYNANVLPDYYSDEIIGLFAEAGINVIGTNFTYYTTAPSYVFKLLEQGEKYHIGVTVWDPMLLEGDNTPEEMDERINQYANYPAFCGVHLCDEPGTPYFRGEGNVELSSLTETAEKLHQLGYPVYANLNGRAFGSENEPQAKEVYEQYLQDCVDTLKLDYISYDRYIFNENKGLNRAYLHFQNLETAKKVAKENSIPFWPFVQAGAQFNDAKDQYDSDGYFPSKGEYLWMGNTCLAYGAKGLGIFPMLQPYWFAYAQSEPFDYQRNGLVGAGGNKTRWFYYTRELTAQIRAIDEVLMNSVSKGVIAAGEDANMAMSNNQDLIAEGAFRELRGVSGDAIVGCFNYQGKTALYVVNYDVEYAQKITLTLHGNCNVEVTQEAQTERYSSDRIILELGAGDGALVVFK